jgi:ATP adenylyltransferase
MNFLDLKDFLENKMSMSHIYQPVLVRALVDSGGSATIRQLASEFLKQDESQIIYYERRIRDMPAKVLKKHGVITLEGNLVSLTVSRLNLQQKAELRKICDAKLQDFIVRNGISIWDCRLIDNMGINDDLRFRVLKEAKGRCALCGASNKDTPLHVDHIIPRNKGGKTIYENLQALCEKCNCTKRDTDETDFRRYGENAPASGIPFFEREWILENGHAFAVLDAYPVTKGHTLVCPKRSFAEAFEASRAEMNAIWELTSIRKRQLNTEDRLITGFNFGVNSGKSAGQTILHCHFHLIPRRDGDTADPTGGVRGVIAERRNYSSGGGGGDRRSLVDA